MRKRIDKSGHRGSLMRMLLVLPFIVSCASLPPPPVEPPTSAIVADGSTRLQRVAAMSLAGFPESGFELLPVATASLEARLALAARAEKSLDVQYYELNGDATGRYFLATLRAGAPFQSVRAQPQLAALQAGQLAR